MKRFSTVGSPREVHRVTEEEEREEGDRGEQEEKKGDSRGDRSTQFPLPRVFSVAQTPTKIHRTGLGREGEMRK